MKFNIIKLDKKAIIKIIILMISIIFFILLIYYFMTVSNKLIGFRIIKDYGPLNKDGISNFDELKDKYKIEKCEQVCKQEFCDEYHIQKIKYDLCKDCKSRGECYDQYKGICVPCENTYSCEELFGCNGYKPPINPMDNYCTRCWIGTDFEPIMSEDTLFLYSSSVTNSSSRSSAVSSSKTDKYRSSSKIDTEEESNNYSSRVKSSYFQEEEEPSRVKSSYFQEEEETTNYSGRVKSSYFQKEEEHTNYSSRIKI
jgi:hypothetical protein